MAEKHSGYRAVVSSDWNECLSPCGPFDPISFHYPELDVELSTTFKQYSSNRISFTEASRRIAAILPAPLTQEQMDSYLDTSFKTYQGVPEFIEWCLTRDILFMINTTGSQGYFQRVFAKGLLPVVPVVSAHSMFRYRMTEGDICQWLDLLEIADKPKNTLSAMRLFGIPSGKVIVIGDSGGDGPLFEWGALVGAFLVGSMTKGSLRKYCGEKGILINLNFGLIYDEGEGRNLDKEMRFDFMGLTSFIESFLGTKLTSR